MEDPPIQALVAHTSLGAHIEKIQNPWIKTQLKIWDKVKGLYKLDNKIEILQWCAFDPGFRPNLFDGTFKNWVSKGLTTSYSLIHNKQVKDFENWKTDFQFNNLDYFRYTQLRNYLRLNILTKTDLDDPVLIIFWKAYENTLLKGMIGKLYKGLLPRKPHSTVYIKERWEKKVTLQYKMNG